MVTGEQTGEQVTEVEDEFEMWFPPCGDSRHLPGCTCHEEA